MRRTFFRSLICLFAVMLLLPSSAYAAGGPTQGNDDPVDWVDVPIRDFNDSGSIDVELDDKGRVVNGFYQYFDYRSDLDKIMFRKYYSIPYVGFILDESSSFGAFSMTTYFFGSDNQQLNFKIKIGYCNSGYLDIASTAISYNDFSYPVEAKNIIQTIYTTAISDFFTNYPIFSSVEDGLKYIETGDWSDADNADQLDEAIEEYSEDITAPQNVTCINQGKLGGIDGNIYVDGLSVGWSTSDMNYVYDYDVRFYMHYLNSWIDKTKYTWNIKKSIEDVLLGDYQLVYKDVLVGAGWTSWNGCNGCIYDTEYNKLCFNSSFLKGVIDKIFSNAKSQKENIKDYLIEKVEFRVRNRSGSKSSRWKVISVDYFTGEVKQETRDNEDIVYDDTGGGSDTTVETSGGNINITITNTNKNEYNSGITWKDIEKMESNNVTLKDIIVFIRDGFGLLGEDGVVAMTKEVFSFIPQEVYSVTLFCVGCLVIVFFLKLMKLF